MKYAFIGKKKLNIQSLNINQNDCFKLLVLWNKYIAMFWTITEKHANSYKYLAALNKKKTIVILLGIVDFYYKLCKLS